MRIGEHESHPLADAFPMMHGAELDQLVESMRSRGFDRDSPVVRIYAAADPRKKLVLDGRNRLRASEIVGVAPKFSDHAILEDGTAEGLGDLAKYVIARNLARRHLSESQRGLIAAKLASLTPGRPKKTEEKTPPRGGVSRAAAAAQLGIGTTTVDRAAKVLREADPKVVEAIEAGHLSVAGATKIARREPVVQRRIVEDVEREAGRTGKEVDGGKVSVFIAKAERRQTAQRIEAEPPPLATGFYRVITDDVPWPYDSRPDDATQRGKLGYPAMSLVAIEAFVANDIERLVHPEGSVLFFWVTNEFIEEALAILRRCGWRKRSFITWDKVNIGLGNTYRNVTEHVIVATKGNPAIHVDGQSTLIREARREHSRKPEAFYRLVEETCPGSKIELHARTKRDGWTSWGAEVDKFERAPASVWGPEGPPAELVEATQRRLEEQRTSADAEYAAVRAEIESAAQDDPPTARAPEDTCLDCAHPACPALEGEDCPTCVADLGDCVYTDEAEEPSAAYADLAAFERERDELVRARPDVRVDLHELSAAQAHELRAKPTDEFAVRIEHGTGSSTGMVCGSTRVEALAAARARLTAPHAKHSKKTLGLGAELRALERMIEGWSAARGAGARGRAAVLPDCAFEVVLESSAAKGRGLAAKSIEAFNAAAAKHDKAEDAAEARRTRAAAPPKAKAKR